MGANNTKSVANKHHHLSSDEYQELKSLFNTISKGKSEGCNENDLTEIWGGMIDRYLLKLIRSYFLRKKLTVDLETFVQLFGGIVRGTIDVKVSVLADLLTCGQSRTAIPVSTVKDYVNSIVSSYLLVLQSAKSKALLSWKSKQCEVAPEELKLFTDFLCQDLPQGSADVTAEDLQMWVGCWSKLATMETLVYESMYRRHGGEAGAGTLSLVPECTGLHGLKGFPSILDLTNITCLNSCLPMELRAEWRFLFSTILHGESFSKLLGSIVNQGPSVLVVQDKGGNIFGGFAPVSWQLGPSFVGSDDSFLFSLRPTMCVYSPTGYNSHYQYLNTHQQTLPNGLGMGGQFDYFGLWLDAEFGRGHSSQSCTTYRDYSMLSSSKDFELSHVEVWGIGPAPKTDEEEGTRSVLDGNLEVKAMLEMVGKTRHSDGVRETDDNNLV